MSLAEDARRAIHDAGMLPRLLQSCKDSVNLAECVYTALGFIDGVHYMLCLPIPAVCPEAGLVLDALQTLMARYEEFWMTRDLDEEARYATVSSSMQELPTARQMVALVVILARGTRFAFDDVYGTGNSAKMVEWTANSFPGVARACIAQSTKPIMDYTAEELVLALDALAFAWIDIEHTRDIDEYVFLLSLRYSVFLRTALPVEQYGGDKALQKEICKTETATAVASPTFIGVAIARFEAFLNVSWRLNQHNCITRAEFLQLSEMNDMALDETSHMEFPPTAEIEIARLLLKYAATGTNSQAINESYSKMLVEFSLWPGDRGVFAARHPHTVSAVTNIVKVMHGLRFRRDLYQRASVVGPNVALQVAINDLVTPRTPRVSHSIQKLLLSV